MAIDIRDMSRNTSSSPIKFKGLKWIIAGVAALFIAANSFTIVPAGNTGVVLTMGEVNSKPLSEGFHLKIPFVQRVENMSNQIQVYETPASAVSSDLQTVNSNIAVNYSLTSDKSPEMYRKVGIGYQNVLIAPAVQECMKSATSHYTAEELITKRQEVSDTVKTNLDARLSEYGIYIEKFNIVNFDFSEEFNNAIESKQVAEQNLLKTQTEQRQTEVVAETSAKNKIVAAQAEADAILAKAQAQADANKLLEESLSDKVIAYEQIQKWDGVMPKVTGSDSGMLIDIDLDSLGGSSQSSQTAPASDNN
ncbi:MAG: prohibitin family protein [Ruminococcus sp.]|nr:prohibitin family protein [Ruminococcus sp.]